MNPAPKKTPIKMTVEEYLAFERASDERHEYFDGIVVPMGDGDVVGMAGERLPHGIISANLVASIVTQLKGTPCFAVTKDTKVRTGIGLLSARRLTKGMFSYPDILIVCGKAEYFDEHHDIVSNPKVIIEVLSPSTETFDRGEKFQRYRAWNATLQEYLLVSQTSPFIEHFRRESDGSWKMTEAVGLEATVKLESIACVLKSVDVYDRVEFPREDLASDGGESAAT